MSSALATATTYITPSGKGSTEKFSKKRANPAKAVNAVNLADVPKHDDVMRGLGYALSDAAAVFDQVRKD